MADIIDQQAKQRGVSRQAYLAYLLKQQQRTGMNGTATPTAPQRPVVQAQRQDPRGPLQRIMDALNGRP